MTSDPSANAATTSSADLADLRANLAESVDLARWDWLQPHARRDAIVVVAGEANLLDVGAAMAADRVDAVRAWIEDGTIHKPTSDQIAAWDGEPDKSFNALIVAPFVLVEETDERLPADPYAAEALGSQSPE